MSNQVLTSLSILTSFHDKNKSVLDSFLPLVEYGIAILKAEFGTSYYESEQLKNKIAASSGITINSLSLKSFLKKIAKDGKIRLLESGKCYQVIDSFLQEQDQYLNAVREHTRNIRKFLRKYKEHSGDLREDQELINWIYEFICEYRQFIDMKNGIITPDINNSKYDALLEFLSYINTYENELSNVFRSIYFGANICSLLDGSLNMVSEKELKKIVVYLDSNFILRLMNLQEEQFTYETCELFKILKDRKISIRVFRETIEEVRSVLTHYLSIYKDNIDDYKILLSNPGYINGVVGAYFRNRLTISQIEVYIDEIYDYVEAQGIKLDSIERYNAQCNEEMKKELILEKYDEIGEGKTKEYRDRKCENYIKIIDIIRYLRKTNNHSSTCLGNSRYVFLTCDYKYYKYGVSKLNAHEFSPVITQEILANDLLIFNQYDLSRMSLQFMSSIYKSSQYIDIHVLDKLKEKIEEIAKENPTEAQYIVRATRNCENYAIINKIFCDDEDDRKQLLELANQIMQEEEKRNKFIEDKDKCIAEKEDTIEAQDRMIATLQGRVSSLEEEKAQRAKEDRDTKLDECANKLYSIKKRAKIAVIFVSILSAIGSVLTIIIGGGILEWARMPIKETWWIWLICAFILVIAAITLVFTNINSGMIEVLTAPQERKVYQKYNLSESDIDEINKRDNKNLKKRKLT